MRTKLTFFVTLVCAALIGGAAWAQQPAGSAARRGSGRAVNRRQRRGGSGRGTGRRFGQRRGGSGRGTGRRFGQRRRRLRRRPPPARAARAAAPAAGARARGQARRQGSQPTWYEELANRPWDTGGTFWMPRSVNKAATGTDTMFYATLGLSIFCFLGITVAVVYFVIRYRHRPGHKAEPSAAHNDTLEITWTIIPTIIVVFLFLFGWRDYVEMVTPPQKAVEVQVLAQKWNWTFTHSNGVSDNVLYVPVNTPVRMVMTSKDVIHSFYVPAFRIKQDVVPGAVHVRVVLRDEARHLPPVLRRVLRRQGRRGPADRAQVPGQPERALPDEDRRGRAQARPVREVPGRRRRHQHAVAGRARPEALREEGLHRLPLDRRHIKVGPSWLHDYGTKAKMSDGSTITVDENYIRESILSPQAKSRPGFPPSMPSFEGQLKDRDIQALIAYIKSLQ